MTLLSPKVKLACITFSSEPGAIMDLSGASLKRMSMFTWMPMAFL